MKKVVTIGGGRGSRAVLVGIAALDIEITAITGVFDTEGPGNQLDRNLNILSLGDIRCCLTGLAQNSTSNKEIAALFSYKFSPGNTAQGLNLGDLLLAALTSTYKDPLAAIQQAEKMLNITNHALPITLEKADIVAHFEDGEKVVGQSAIDTSADDARRKIVDMSLNPAASILPAAEKAIRDAEIIIFCPGDLYTSLIPNFLVQGFREAINKSTARTIAICNISKEKNGTNVLDASNGMRELLRYSELKKFDYIICHEDDQTLADSTPEVDEGKLQLLAKNVLIRNLISTEHADRHESTKIASVIKEIIL